MKGVSHKPLIIHVLSKPGNLLFALFVKQTPQTLQIMLLVTDVVYALTQTTPKKKKKDDTHSTRHNDVTSLNIFWSCMSMFEQL